MGGHFSCTLGGQMLDEGFGFGSLFQLHSLIVLAIILVRGFVIYLSLRGLLTWACNKIFVDPSLLIPLMSTLKKLETFQRETARVWSASLALSW